MLKSNLNTRSVLYPNLSHSASTASQLPDLRLRQMQEECVEALTNAKSILQIGNDGGHFALMALHYSNAKCVLLEDGSLVGQVIIDFFASRNDRLAILTDEVIMGIEGSIFDLVYVYHRENQDVDFILEKYRHLITKGVKVIVHDVDELSLQLEVR